MRTLPDHLRKGMKLVIVGCNPSESSVRVGHYYAGRGNQFWPMLYEGGVVPEPFDYHDDKRVIEFGIGLTDLVKRPTRGVEELKREDFAEGRIVLSQKLEEFTPHVVAFNGKLTYEQFAQRKCKFGIQKELLYGARVYVLPSTSGANAAGKHQKLQHFLVLTRGVRAAGGGQNVDARPVKQLFLNAKLAFALGKLFVRELPVEGHHMRREFLELLRKHDAAFGKIFALQFFHPPRGALDKVGEPNPEFNHTLVVMVIERFRHNAALVEHGPELIPASGVVMTDAHGRLTRIAADDHKLHAFAQMVWEGSHGASLLCLSIFLLALEMGCALFDIGGQTFLGVLAGEEQLLEFTLDAQSFTKRNFRTGHDGSLDPADRDRGLIGRTELLGIGYDILPVGFAIINVVNQTHPQGFFKAEGLAPGH